MVMKLDEIISYPVLEITKGPTQPIGLKDPQLISQLAPTGIDIEGFSLCALSVDDNYVFALKDKDELLSMLAVTTVDDFPEKDRVTLKVGRSWTPPEHRNKGYSTALYDGLARAGYRLVSDLMLSPEAISVWERLKTKRTVKSFDVDMRQFTDKDPLTDERSCFVLESAPQSHCKLLYDSKMFTVIE